MAGVLVSAVTVGAVLIAAASPPLSDVIKRDDEEWYTVRIEGRVAAYQHHEAPEIQQHFNLKNTPLVIPLFTDGGYGEADKKDITATLMLDGVPAKDNGRFKIIEADVLGTRFGRFMIDEFKGDEIEFKLEQVVKVYNATVDEKRAMAATWPSEWPPEVLQALQPQMYIESTNESVVKAVETLTQGKPKAVSPYVLTKVLAKWTTETYRPLGRSFTNDRYGAIDGIEVQGAAEAVTKKRGSFFNAVCLYVAACRASGLPARPVIGIDTGEKDELTAWAEVFLPAIGWVSVDIREIYSAPGRARNHELAWPGIGSDDELNELVPVTNHFHPPVGVGGGDKGKPLLWSWLPQPEIARTEQRIRISVMTAPNSGDRQRNPNQEDRPRRR